MKIIKSSVNVKEQEPGIVGMFRHMEIIGRLSHKSENKITNDSYINFISLMKKIGHWAVFDMGTVYLKFSVFNFRLLWKLLKHHPFSKLKVHGLNVYATTTYRIILQEDIEPKMEKYWIEPTKYHKKRITAHFICSRAISHELVRHASLRPLQESTRYCNYGGSKFGSEITYILPQWIYEVRDEIGNTIDPLTGESREWILKEDGQELWDILCCYDRTVSSRDKKLKEAEEEYMWEISTDESHKLRPEDARGGLPHDLKTELYMCGYQEDWCMKPRTSERTGFFYLRSDKSAHPDVRVLSQELEKIFKEMGYYETN